MKLVSTNPWRLTPREVEVMDALVFYTSQKAVAKSLCIGVFTVRDHAKSVRLKMGETGHLGYLRKWIEFRARQEA